MTGIEEDANTMKMGDLKIGTRLYAGFLIKILLLLTVGLVALYQMNLFGRLVTEMYDHPMTVGFKARDIRGEVYAMSDLALRMASTEDSGKREELGRTIDEIETRALHNFDIVRERYLGPEKDVTAARDAFVNWGKERNEALGRLDSEGVAKPDKSFASSQRKYVEDVLGKIQKIVEFSGGKAWYYLETAGRERAHLRAVMLSLLGAAVLLGLTVTFIVIRSITPPLYIIVRRMKDIAAGDLGHEVEISQKDEIGELADSFREMQAGLRDKAEVAMSVAAGDFSRTVEVKGSRDLLGNALDEMTRSLRRAKRESDLRDWVKTGKNELNRIIVGQSDINLLSREIIGFLARHINAQIGTVYLATDSGMLALGGSFAFSKRKSLAATIEPGEGLVGQAAVEKDIISITNIPDDYIRINSSFGDSPPRNIVALPLVFEDAVKGVIELGSFEELLDEKLDFLRDISSSVAIAFHTVQNQMRLKQLLDETQRQAAQLQVQEEELRTANEELEEQTRSLKESENRLKQQQEEMEVINEELEEKNDFLENQKEQIARKNRELEEIRAELELRAGELEVTGRYKSEFLANMSHELRTPLNSLLLLSRDLSENRGGNLSESQVESAKVIHNSGVELLNLIDEILDLAKIEAGKMVLKVEDVRLSDVAGYVERSFGRVAEEKGISFGTVVGEGLPDTIRTDRQRLEQVLKNLISNAVKFTDKGSVTVEISSPAAVDGASKADPRRGYSVAFSVRDTGIGIPEEKQLVVFEAFQQLDGGTTRKYGGTGLGLSISRDLARLLSGEIKLESRPGEGSTFTLYLPEEPTAQALQDKNGGLAVARKKAADPELPSPSASGKIEVPPAQSSIPDDREDIGEGDRSILIIEDDPAFAGILRDQCHSKGFKALVSPTGEAGLKLAEKFHPAAVILDIKLPGMSGWTVLSTLKENPATRHMPVHIMTVEEASIDALQRGAIGFLRKPVAREELDEAFGKIEEVVDKKIKDLLIVEDNPHQRRAIINLIADADLRIVEAESGADAIAALRACSFDCLILDLGLPDMTGFDFLNAMAGAADISPPPVIVYTGKELTREEERELRKHAESLRGFQNSLGKEDECDKG
jgi:signal transduction histidine kinase/DNA-binding response OmpR family regulator/HAMP domain-containing protein